MNAVHLQSAGRIACGVDQSRRWASTVLTSTHSIAGVTCRRCLKVPVRDAADRGGAVLRVLYTVTVIAVSVLVTVACT